MVDPAPYVLGHSDVELRRLESQARVMAPVTRRFLAEAGIGTGMRVLDVGSGGGDVTLLVADLVGPSGQVVGFDPSQVAVESARAKATARGAGNVAFLAGTVEELGLDRDFDAVVGRYVLQFHPEPARLLREVAGHAHPGAPVVFHELDWSGVRSDPPVPTYDRLAGWLHDAIAASGASTHAGLALPATFRAAGLGDPVLRLEQRLGAGEAALEVVERMAHLAGSLSATLVARGVASLAELEPGELVERIMSEVRASHSLVRSHLQLGAWATA
jgi:SAM-dependent methyltransferase